MSQKSSYIRMKFSHLNKPSFIFANCLSIKFNPKDFTCDFNNGQMIKIFVVYDDLFPKFWGEI